MAEIDAARAAARARVWAAAGDLLVAEAAAGGQPMAARTAWALCSANRWWSAIGKPRQDKGRRPGPPVHDDQVKRVFTAAEANRLWLTDITEHATAEGKLYLCAVKTCTPTGSSATPSVTG